MPTGYNFNAPGEKYRQWTDSVWGYSPVPRHLKNKKEMTGQDYLARASQLPG
jgi:hypothetical protein